MVTSSGVAHLVLGASGQVGSALVEALRPQGGVVGLQRPRLDLCRHGDLAALVREYRPRVLWNAAAATAVDALEDDPDLAFTVNAVAPGVLAEECRRLGAVMVHFSTDYVFDGEKAEPYVEDDPTGPLNVYGWSKLEGERAVARVGGAHLILRTSWVYSAGGRNFVRAVVRRRRGDVIRVVTDQVGSPTWSGALARCCAGLAGSLVAGRATSGVFHLAAGGATSWYEFALAIRDQLVSAGVAWPAPIEPATTREFGGRVRRPHNSRLACGKAARQLGASMADWRAELTRMLSEPGALEAVVDERD